MRNLILVATAAALLLAGCANLVVRKVPLDKRLSHADHHVDGFRYYLSRPYVLVLEPIPLTQTQVLVALESDGKFTFLDGPRAGETSTLDEQKKENHTSTAVTPLSPAEAARLQGMIQDRSTEGAIQPVQFRRGNYTQNVVIA